MVSREKIISALLETNGHSFSDELGLDLARNTPSLLFRWLVASTLLSARIHHSIALEAARALSRAGWRSASTMARSTWKERAQVLNRSGYARYDESTSRMLGDTAEKMLSLYGGDLRRLREAAGHDPAEDRHLLKTFKGIGDVGADIFFREMQAVWEEQYPFADKKALSAAEKLGLPGNAEALSRLVPRSDLPRLLCALVRTALDKSYAQITRAAERY